MLTEKRLDQIVSLVNANGSITVTDLMETLDASESTIRRDLAALDESGKLLRVRGGAMAVKGAYGTQDDDVVIRASRNISQKQVIAGFAASLIQDDDFVFLDAGTTTELVVPYITARNAVFVTNALSHAAKLSERGFDVFILGGEFKNTTAAIVGEEALISLRKYNFTKGFFGTNGVHPQKGYTTPEMRESRIKSFAMKRCLEAYVLADSSKLGQVAAITFGQFEDARVITERIPQSFGQFENVMEVAAQ